MQQQADWFGEIFTLVKKKLMKADWFIKNVNSSTSGAKKPKKEFTRFLKPTPAEDFKKLYSLESPT